MFRGLRTPPEARKEKLAPLLTTMVQGDSRGQSANQKGLTMNLVHFRPERRVQATYGWEQFDEIHHFLFLLSWFLSSGIPTNEQDSLSGLRYQGRRVPSEIMDTLRDLASLSAANQQCQRSLALS